MSILLSCDVLIIGSGAAGLSLALRLPTQYSVIILNKGLTEECSTFYAQGGIASVFEETDSIDSHVEDTMIAGDGIVDRTTAEFVISNAQHCVQWLIDQGVTFDTKTQLNNVKKYHLNQEGAHSHRRILHVKDITGKEIETLLISKVRSLTNVQIFEYSNVVDLILSDRVNLKKTRQVIGAWIWNCKKKQIETYQAKIVVLATGGASNVYKYTTNPDSSSGDGIAIAWRAGCKVANLEFNQFHPTTFFCPKGRNFLLTEALRGEGALLKRPDGSRFMNDFDKRGELAPRDVVVRAMNHEMKRLGVDFMYLDISHKPTNFIQQHFPTIYRKLLTFGIDLTKEPVPIVPAAHYTCGGVVVNNYGQTNIDRLYAIGEVSYTGLHGANRIASNSLLECLVYSWSASKDISKCKLHTFSVQNLPVLDKIHIEKRDESVIVQNHLDELRSLMWDRVGVVRTENGLKTASNHIAQLQKKVEQYYANFCISNNLLKLRNLVQVAELVVHCAIMRKESRGSHHMIDYPEKMIINSGPTVLHHR